MPKVVDRFPFRFPVMLMKGDPATTEAYLAESQLQEPLADNRMAQSYRSSPPRGIVTLGTDVCAGRGVAYDQPPSDQRTEDRHQ